MVRADELILAADAAQECQRRIIAGQQQMVAVVDLHSERRIEIGAAAAAGVGRGLVDDDLARHQSDQPQGGGEAGKAGADDMDAATSEQAVAQQGEEQLCRGSADLDARRREAACQRAWRR